MQPRKLLTISALILSSCASAPAKPNVELGVIDYPNNEVIINMTGATKFTEMSALPTYKETVRAIVVGSNRVPLASYDRAIAFKPKAWQQVQDYLNSLVRYINNHCQAGQ